MRVRRKLQRRDDGAASGRTECCKGGWADTGETAHPGGLPIVQPCPTHGAEHLRAVADVLTLFGPDAE